jgi:methyl-accepting chemotaxis protein
MTLLTKLRISQLLGAAFSICFVAILAIAALGYLGLEHVSGQVERLTSDRLAKVNLARDAKDQLNEVGISLRNLVTVFEFDQKKAEKKLLEQQRAAAAKSLDQLYESDSTGEIATYVADLKALSAAYAAAADEATVAAMEGNSGRAQAALVEKIKPTHTKLFKALDTLIAEQQTAVARAMADVNGSVGVNKLLGLAFAATALLLAGGLGVLATVAVTRPIGGEPSDVSAMANAIAGGDLSYPINAAGARPGSIVASMAAMQSELRAIVERVREGSDNIAVGSSQIASGNTDLSSRTEDQARKLQETASSMQGLAGNVSSSAVTAGQANQLAMVATTAATEGGARVAEVVNTMDNISAASKKIVDIIAVIDGIAFQTNILALNAAVEAARAGEQGRGFAVVASEVRSLAQRSATAAKAIKSLIIASVEHVDAGAKRVGAAHSAMHNIVQQVTRMSQLISEIANAASEQTADIDSVNNAVRQIDEFTQQNSALCEQSAAATENLKHQILELTKTMAFFKLNSADRSA